MINHHNFDYLSGVPTASGDRYFAGDLARDFRFHQDRVGKVYSDLTGGQNVIMSGLEVTQGAGTTFTITAGSAVILFNVEVPNSTAGWAVPSPTTTADVFMHTEVALLTSQAVAGWTAGGATNYLKLKYSETALANRARAKSSGTYDSEKVPAYTLTCDITAPTAYEIELTRFTEGGGSFTFNHTYRAEFSMAGPASIFLASSDSPPAMKVRADRIISTASDSGAIISEYSRILTTFGGTIYLAEGTFNCSTNAIIYSNVTLSGNGIGTVLKRMALSGAMSGVVSTLNAASNIRLKNFKVDGNNGTYTGAGILLGTTCSYVTLSDITCINNTTSGVHLATSTFVTIKDCVLAGDNYVIDASDSSDARIMNNSILTGSASAAVVIGSKSIVKGNQITSGASYSIRSVAATPRSIISDNHITCATRTGIYLYEGSDYCIVSNNLVDCAGSGTGIQLLKSDLCVVSGNVIIDPSTGISITGDGGSGCISCTVIGNTIYSASTIGITVSAASCQYNVLIGNATDEGANNSITNSGTGTLCGIITGAVVNLAGAYINH